MRAIPKILPCTSWSWQKSEFCCLGHPNAGTFWRDVWYSPLKHYICPASLLDWRKELAYDLCSPYFSFSSSQCFWQVLNLQITFREVGLCEEKMPPACRVWCRWDSWDEERSVGLWESGLPSLAMVLFGFRNVMPDEINHERKVDIGRSLPNPHCLPREKMDEVGIWT